MASGHLIRLGFYVPPAEVRSALTELDGHLLEFTDEPLAEEFRQSQNERNRVAE